MIGHEATPDDTGGALQESEARYRALFRSLDHGFCVIEVLFDDDGRAVDYRFTEANPAFEQQSGLTDVVGRTARALVPDLEQDWIDAYARIVRTGEAARFDSASMAMGRWFDVYAFPFGAPAERRVAVLFTDITAARAAEQERERLLHAIAVESSRLADAFHHAPSFMVVYRGAEFVYEFVNEAYYQLVGHRDILGKPLLDALPEVRGQGFDALLARVMETGEPWVGRETPARLQRTPGVALETRYLDMVFQALTDADGTRSGIVAHGTDVTEHVLARREVERLLVESERARAEADAARNAAVAADQAKSQFLATMSHELRTPLNAIQGHLQLLDLGLHGPVTPEQRATFARIDRAQRHLLGLVNDVLNYARLGSGKVEYRVEPVLVADILNDVLPMVEPQLAAKGLGITVWLPELGPDGPTGQPPVPVLADREKLGQVFLNLLSNAIKFTERGGHVTVALTARADGSAPPGLAYFRVSDTGIGIPPDKLETVFEPFVQVRSDYARTAGGTGLGLAISRDLARGMGGDLRARSTPGVGSAFTVSLRRAAQTPP